jgi:DNA-binding XRE family transcriptional regulator
MPAIDPARLRAAREYAGLGREYVAITLGRSYHTIQAYETGQAVPPGNVLVTLAALYGVTVEDLCRGEAPAGAR